MKWLFNEVYDKSLFFYFFGENTNFMKILSFSLYMIKVYSIFEVEKCIYADFFTLNSDV